MSFDAIMMSQMMSQITLATVTKIPLNCFESRRKQRISDETLFLHRSKGFRHGKRQRRSKL